MFQVALLSAEYQFSLADDRLVERIDRYLDRCFRSILSHQI